MPEVVLTAVISFISTNIDDLFVLLLLFSQAAEGRDRTRIMAGQYLGTGSVIVLSLLGAYGTRLLLADYLGLLGVVPILLGLRYWAAHRKGEGAEEEPRLRLTVPGVALLCLGNGADNIGVYIPLFSRYEWPALVLTAALFLVLIGLWCLLARSLAAHRAVQAQIRRWQHILVPLVLILLGLSIIWENL